MEDKTLTLNQYEAEALKTSLEKYSIILEEQISSLKSVKHLDNAKKKELQNSLGKRRDMLKSILTKLN
ncbi:MAG: hypothetical protein ABIJ34_04030 [archaeon]